MDEPIRQSIRRRRKRLNYRTTWMDRKWSLKSQDSTWINWVLAQCMFTGCPLCNCGHGKGHHQLGQEKRSSPTSKLSFKSRLSYIFTTTPPLNTHSFSVFNPARGQQNRRENGEINGSLSLSIRSIQVRPSIYLCMYRSREFCWEKNWSLQLKREGEREREMGIAKLKSLFTIFEFLETKDKNDKQEASFLIGLLCLFVWTLVNGFDIYVWTTTEYLHNT